MTWLVRVIENDGGFRICGYLGSVQRRVKSRRAKRMRG